MLFYVQQEIRKFTIILCLFGFFSQISNAATVSKTIYVNLESLRTSEAVADVNVHVGVANQANVLQPGFIFYANFPTLLVDGTPISQSMSLALTSALATGRQVRLTFDETCTTYYGYTSCFRSINKVKLEN